MNTEESKVLHKLDGIIDEMLSSGEPEMVREHYDRLIRGALNDDSARVQLVMALMAEVAENDSDKVSEQVFERHLKKLPINNLSEL